MPLFGLIISIFFYVSLILLFGLFLCAFFRKNYKFANQLLMLLFVYSMIVIMALSWALVIMNSGFNVKMSIYLNNDYTWLAFVFMALLFGVVLSDTIIKRHIEQDKHMFFVVARFILPLITVIAMTADTFILFSSCNYFKFLSL